MLAEVRAQKKKCVQASSGDPIVEMRWPNGQEFVSLSECDRLKAVNRKGSYESYSLS